MGEQFKVNIITKGKKKITLEDIMGEIIGMKKDINELKQDNIKTKTTLKDIMNEIVEMKKDINELKRDNIKTKTTLKDIMNEIVDIKKDIVDIKTRLTVLESDMANVKIYLKKQDSLNETFINYMQTHS
jgi:chromosome segregation ATPase